MTYSTILKLICITLVIQSTHSNSIVLRTKTHRETRKGSLKRSQTNEFFADFQRYDAIEKFLIEKSKQNPNIVNLSTIGQSVEGRKIYLMKIGEGINKTTNPVIYIDGGMHAREWAAITTALYIIDNLIRDYSKNDQDAKLLLSLYDFYIVPVLNPDGYEFTHTMVSLTFKNH